MLEIGASCLVLTALLAYMNHRFIRLPITIGVMVSALLMSLGLVAIDAMGIAPRRAPTPLQPNVTCRAGRGAPDAHYLRRKLEREAIPLAMQGVEAVGQDADGASRFVVDIELVALPNVAHAGRMPHEKSCRNVGRRMRLRSAIRKRGRCLEQICLG